MGLREWAREAESIYGKDPVTIFRQKHKPLGVASNVLRDLAPSSCLGLSHMLSMLLSSHSA